MNAPYRTKTNDGKIDKIMEDNNRNPDWEI